MLMLWLDMLSILVSSYTLKCCSQVQLFLCDSLEEEILPVFRCCLKRFIDLLKGLSLVVLVSKSSGKYGTLS